MGLPAVVGTIHSSPECGQAGYICKLCRAGVRPRTVLFRTLPPLDPVDVLRVALDAPHEPPTANVPDELPDQEGSRYPLMKVSRESAPMIVLLAYLFRVLWWRCATWSQRRRGME